MTKEEFIKTLDIFEIEEIKDYCLNGSNKQNKKITLRNNIQADEDKTNKLEQDLKTTILIANKRQETIQYYEKIVNEIITKVKLIVDLGFDYDGFNDTENLKKLIDGLVKSASDIIDILKGSENNDC